MALVEPKERPQRWGISVPSVSPRTRVGWDGRLTRHAREVASFVAATGMAISLLAVTVTLSNGETLAHGAGNPLIDGWRLTQTGLAAVGMVIVGVRARSLALSVFAAVLSAVAAGEQTSWISGLGGWLGDRLDLTAATNWIGAPPDAWGEFLVFVGVATLLLIVVFALPNRRHKRQTAVLTLLLALLFLFSAVFDLLAAAGSDLPFGWIEEVGELVVVALLLGYVSGLLVDGAA